MQANWFISILDIILKTIPTNCLIVIIDDFNINMLTHTSQSTTLQNFMNIYDIKIILHKSTIIYNTQLDHTQTNAPIQQCHFKWT